MGISPIGAVGAVAGLIPGGISSISSKEDIENTVAKLKKQREEYSVSLEDTARERKISELDKRISNLEQRLDKMKTQDSECETCKNRKYQDGSDDPSVSFKTASKINGNAEAAVRSHEYEHVNNNRAEARREGKEIVYQSVVIKHGICPECGEVYVAGGETTTVTRTDNSAEEKAQPKTNSRFQVGLSDPTEENGKLLNIVA